MLFLSDYVVFLVTISQCVIFESEPFINTTIFYRGFDKKVCKKLQAWACVFFASWFIPTVRDQFVCPPCPAGIAWVLELDWLS